MRIVPTILCSLLAVSACQPIPDAVRPGAATTQRASISVGVQVGSPFAVQAAPKTTDLVANLKYELLNASAADAVVATQTQSGTSYTFSDVADGSYKVRVTALDAGNASITATPLPTSGVISVSNGVVTYPGALPGLTLTVPLLDGTGEKVLNQVTVSGYVGNAITPTTYKYRLMRTSGTPGQVATFDSAQQATHFSGVPDGTYELKVEAFDGARSITVGGEQTSSNTITVDATAMPAITTFAVSLKLFIDKWAAAANLNSTRYAHGAALAGGKIYAVGGYDLALGGQLLGTVEQYDPVSHSWQVTSETMLTPRSQLAVVALNGELYAIGGQTSGAHTTVESCTPGAPWVTKGDLNTARGGLAAAAAPNGKIYAIGGQAGSTYFDTNEEYDPGSNTWAAKALMPTPRTSLAVAAAPNGKIYAIGGRDGTQTLATVEEYDPVSNTWTTKAPMPTARWGLAAATGSDGRIYAIGGRSGAFSKKVEVYDPVADTWATKADLSVSREAMGAALGADGKIYVVGGRSGNDPVDTVEAYDP